MSTVTAIYAEPRLNCPEFRGKRKSGTTGYRRLPATQANETDQLKRPTRQHLISARVGLFACGFFLGRRSTSNPDLEGTD